MKNLKVKYKIQRKKKIQRYQNKLKMMKMRRMMKKWIVKQCKSLEN